MNGCDIELDSIPAICLRDERRAICRNREKNKKKVTTL
jgi:hypothetical protein